MRINRPEEPAYSGGLTYHKVPLALEPEDLVGADVAILGAPMDDMVTHRPGTRFGPREIRIATDVGGPPEMWHMDLGVDPFAELNVVDYGDATVIPGDAHASHRGIRKAVADVVAAGAIPIILGGDHSISYPDIAAVAAGLGRMPEQSAGGLGRMPEQSAGGLGRTPEQSAGGLGRTPEQSAGGLGRTPEQNAGGLAVVHFDTHADTADELSGLKWTHGSPFRRLVDDGIVRGDRLVQIGLRGYWPFPEEFAWMRDVGIRWHRMDEIFDRGIDDVMNDVEREIEGADALFVSVDIDVLDPAYAPGTGTPEPGGMTTRDLLRAVRHIVLARPFVGMDVVEVSPPYDHAGITAMAAHRVVMEALSAFAVQRAARRPAPEEPR